MKQYFFVLLTLLPFCLSAQQFRFLLNGSDIENHTFNLKEDKILIKATFLNNTAYKFNISALNVMVRIPQYKNLSQQSASPAGYKTEIEVVQNAATTFSKSPALTFDLKKIITKYNCQKCEFAFKINKFISDSEEGNNWIDQNLLYNEVVLKESIITNPAMSGKTDHN